MRKRVGLKEASRITGLSEWELRTGAIAGKYPHFRVGGPRGRIIFDIEILESHINNMILNSITQEEPTDYGVLRKVK
ncbi:hypothetical protein [uncultured Tissierella sp.]|uniref:hypothetical protein n=1 Tax=uncultured Tissierella sp. TaxID=448160 RepID=UPI0028051E9A|nr:hypothetical protein [uncultured Tissierella sp.]MDU5081986.1 hypothetical protein [Bacillota bacterium]